MKQVIAAFFAAGILALSLTACGGTMTQEPESAVTASRTHAFHADGCTLDVTVDLRGGWDAAFEQDSAVLYDGPIDGEREPAAFGTYESREGYEERLSWADSYMGFSETENGVTYTDSAGVQSCLLDLGEGVYYRISVRPEQDAGEIFDRFDVTLTEAPPPGPEESLYLTLVNRTHKLPERWEEKIELLETQNYFGEPVRVERTAYEAYQALRADLLAEGVDIELESCYRSVERQTELWAEYEEKYGPEYCRQYVAVPGFSEHHTGFAIDTNLIQAESQATDEEREVERARLWEKVHQKLPEYGFILRYMQGKEAITGYSYEPWHLRYVGDPGLAGEIAGQGVTLEEYLGEVEPSDAVVDYGSSILYTEDEREDAVSVLRAEFDTWEGCALQSVRYAGDECGSPENLEWMNSLGDGTRYAACIAFFTDFHTPAETIGGLEPDTEYTDYPWRLARTFGGEWELMTWG